MNRGRRRQNQGNGMAVDTPKSNSSELKVPFIEIRNWEGGSVVEVVNFLERKTRCKLQAPKQQGNVVVAQVLPKDVHEFVKWNQYRFAGRSLGIKVTYKASPEATATIQVLQQFLQQRYVADLKLLNLSAMMMDQSLVANGFLDNPVTALKMFQALMKVSLEILPAVDSVSLEGNGLPDVKLLLHVDDSYPHLKHLSLANNQISSVDAFNELSGKFGSLNELVLNGNPLTLFPTYHQDAQKIVALFPQLLVLDGVQVRSEADLPSNSLPLPIVPNFFADDFTANLTPAFLLRFFELWDTNRAAMCQFYDELSLFSFSYDGYCPGIRNKNTRPPADYLHQSRNIWKNSGRSVRHDRIHVGRNLISRVFETIPATKHDLQKPSAFAIDSWKVGDVRQPGDQAIMMIVHGEFYDVKHRETLGFDRTLVVTVDGMGNHIVSNDMLTIRSKSAIPFPEVPANEQPAQVPQLQPGVSPSPAPVPAPMPGPIHNAVPGSIPQQVPGAVPQQVAGAFGMPGVAPPSAGVPGPTPAGAPLPNNVSTPPPGSNEIVSELMGRTMLTPEYASMCLMQANMDLNTALQLFEQSKARLPIEAFQRPV